MVQPGRRINIDFVAADSYTLLYSYVVRRSDIKYGIARSLHGFICITNIYNIRFCKPHSWRYLLSLQLVTRIPRLNSCKTEKVESLEHHTVVYNVYDHTSVLPQMLQAPLYKRIIPAMKRRLQFWQVEPKNSRVKGRLSRRFSNFSLRDTATT